MSKASFLKLWTGALILSVLCAGFDYASAGTTYVSNTNNTGTGSLRRAITDSNSAGGTNTVSWLTGSGGTIYLYSSLPSINGATTLDVTSSTNSVVLYSYNNAVMGLGGAVTINNNNVSNAMGIYSVVSGTGSLTKTGDGDLYLLGSNTYTGGTAINGGTVYINGNASLGDSSGGISFNGGVLKQTADVSMSRLITLNAGGGVFDTQSYQLTLSGVISGSGALTKRGIGTLYLNAANTYTGGTVVSSGTLSLGVNNALASGGAVTVGADATLDAGSYTQSVASYNGTGTLAMKLASGVTNLSVAGAAMVGGTLSLSFDPQLFTPGETFTPITAGLLSGSFSSILSPAALLFTPTYNSGNLVLTVSMVPFTNISATADQAAVGNVLEPLRTAPTGDVATVLSNLYSLRTEALRSALDQMGPGALSSMRGLSFSASDLQSLAVSRRARSLGKNLPSGPAPEPDEDFPDLPAAAPQSASYQSETGFGLFVSGVGGKTNVMGSAYNAAYSLYNGGVLLGGDYSLHENVSVGVAVSQIYGKADISYPGSGTVKSRSTRYGVYAAGGSEALHLSGYIGRADNKFDSRRQISYADISRTATASPHGEEFNAYAGASYDIQTEGWGVLSPLAEFNYDKVQINSFTEDGADSLDLSVDKQTAQSLRSSLGAKYAATGNLSGCFLSSYVSTGWRHEFKRQTHIDAALAASGETFSVSGGDFGTEALLAGLGVGMDWGGPASLRFDYSGDFRARLTQHSLNASFNLKF